MGKLHCQPKINLRIKIIISQLLVKRDLLPSWIVILPLFTMRSLYF